MYPAGPFVSIRNQSYVEPGDVTQCTITLDFFFVGLGSPEQHAFAPRMNMYIQQGASYYIHGMDIIGQLARLQFRNALYPNIIHMPALIHSYRLAYISVLADRCAFMFLATHKSTNTCTFASLLGESGFASSSIIHSCCHFNWREFRETPISFSFL